MKEKQKISVQPVAVIKVWKHPIDGNHIDVSTYKEILDLPAGEYDLYIDQFISPDPTAAIEDFKRRVLAEVTHQLYTVRNMLTVATAVREAIESLPLIEEARR